MTSAVWRNWARTQAAHPVRTVRPRDVEELSAAVRAAAHDGLPAKAVGSGHSFTGIAATGGVLIRMDAMGGALNIDARTGLATVEAGMPLHRLNRVLAAHGLALPNLGDIDRQTVSGAISTGTHGTGARLGGLATQVRALELVGADGAVARCSLEENPELFAAARVGLGALGVISRVTLQCVPAFALRVVDEPMPLNEVLDGLDHLVADNDHFEFFWFPHTSRALAKRNNRLPDGAQAQPPGRLRAWFDEEFVANTVYEQVNRMGSAFPQAIPRLNGIASGALSHREYSQVSYRAFTSPRRVVFTETEYAVPRESVTEVFQELRRWIDRSGERTTFPVEVRFARADDIWLSTAHRRDTAYIAVHQYHRLPYERYFRAFADIAGGVGGRPHWGKLHWLGAETLRTRYPCFDDFTSLRTRLDPAGTFANPYLDRVLGPV